MIIDLRSDTVTKPSPAMKEAMLNAPLGDDVFAEDPTTNELEQRMADMFQKEAAIYCPSGTMTNQIAIKVHTKPLDEVITDKLAHIYNYEVGGYAYHSGVSIKLLDGDRGRITPQQVVDSIKPNHDWLPNSQLVVVENTCNKGGGSYYQLEEIAALSQACRENNLKFHLDGARLFNALLAIDKKAADIGPLFDSISICISKGLGAPVGSVLVGDKESIGFARKVRKVMGGGMRQCGMIAAACLYAIDNNIERLAEDHRRAKKLEEVLAKQDYVSDILPVDTNILIFEIKDELPGPDFIQQLADQDIKAIEFSKQQIRFVTHLDFTEEMLEKTIQVLENIKY